MREYPYLLGQLIFDYSLEILDALFQETGLNHEMRQSSHYQNGNYLKVSLNDRTVLKIEKINSSECLISGEADDQIELSTFAELTSSFLSEKKLKHRLELYDTTDKEFCYHHYEWVKE